MLIGIVGKPNCGKSTMFKAITLSPVNIGNYPFVTIEPNKGIGYVRVQCPEVEFGVKCTPNNAPCYKGNRFVPFEIMDVAGLVPGAHEGRGLGNKFLDDLRQADAFIHVVDASGSTDMEGNPVPPGTHDPAKDIRFLEEEIDHWFTKVIRNNTTKFRNQKKDIKKLAEVLSGLGVKLNQIEKALKEVGLNFEDVDNWKDEDFFKFASKLRKIAKPMVIAANKMDIPQAKENIERLKREFPEYEIVPTSAEAELALREAADKGLIEYIPGDSGFKIIGKLNEKQKKGLEIIRKVLQEWGSTGVQEVLNKVVLDVLGYIVVFPGGARKLQDSKGRILPDAFLLPPGSTALDFAYKIHTDLGKNFISAIDVRTKKHVGKDYKLKNRDVIEIVAGK